MAILTVMGLGLGFSAQPAAADDDDKVEQRNQFFVNNSAREVGGLAVLKRTDSGVKLHLTTSITPGDAATVWWIVYNQPQRCTGGPVAPGLAHRCTSSDRTWDHASVHYGGGMVAGPDGRFVVNTTLGVGDLAALAMGTGLTHPRQAEIHAVVRTHGPASSDPEVRQSQVSTMDGGCDKSELPPLHPLRGIEGGNTCTSIQWTFFGGLDDDDDDDDDD